MSEFSDEYIQQHKALIIDAWAQLRKTNSDIPSDWLDLMRDLPIALLEDKLYEEKDSQIKQLETELSELREKHRWHFIDEEGLPEEHTRYLFTVENSKGRKVCLMNRRQIWNGQKIIAYTPLPAPAEGK